MARAFLLYFPLPPLPLALLIVDCHNNNNKQQRTFSYQRAPIEQRLAAKSSRKMKNVYIPAFICIYSQDFPLSSLN